MGSARRIGVALVVDSASSVATATTLAAGR
jgi:hypothetical protein